MTRKKFLMILCSLILSFVFIKIYQHNILIKLNYQKQRLEKKKHNLKRKKADLVVKLCTLKYETIQKIAQKKYGMTQLQTSQIIAVPQKTPLHITHTTTQ